MDEFNIYDCIKVMPLRAVVALVGTNLDEPEEACEEVETQTERPNA